MIDSFEFEELILSGKPTDPAMLSRAGGATRTSCFRYKVLFSRALCRPDLLMESYRRTA